MFDSSTDVSMDTKALIFTNGTVDRFGRVWPLSVSGLTRDGRAITAARNVYPSLTAVTGALMSAERCGMTALLVHPDSCG